MSTLDTGEDKLGELRGLRSEGRFTSASTEEVFCHLQAQSQKCRKNLGEVLQPSSMTEGLRC